MRFHSILLAVLLSMMPRMALAQDCNARCCTKVFGRNACEPVCKSSCEAEKAARGAGVPVPDVGPSKILAEAVDEVEKAMQAYCARGFEVINKTVILNQSPYPAGSERILNQAKEILIQLNIIGGDEFQNVTIRWAELVGWGQAPDRNIVLLSDAYLRDNNLLSATATLAHEMVHIRQYRSMGTDNFKCQYSRIFVGCGGCQDEHHALEREAIVFERQHSPAIGQFIVSNVRGTAWTCVTQSGTCRYPQPTQSGMMCQCDFGYGIVWGVAR